MTKFKIKSIVITQACFRGLPTMSLDTFVAFTIQVTLHTRDLLGATRIRHDQIEQLIILIIQQRVDVTFLANEHDLFFELLFVTVFIGLNLTFLVALLYRSQTRSIVPSRQQFITFHVRVAQAKRFTGLDLVYAQGGDHLVGAVGRNGRTSSPIVRRVL